MTQANLDLFDEGIAAWNRGEYEVLVDMCHPDVEWTFSDRLPDATGEIHGKAAVRSFFERFTSDWAEIFIRPERVVDAGDDVVTLVEFVARGRDGVEASMHFVHVWTIRDGLVVRFRGFQTFEEALEAAGARAQPG